MNPVLTLAALAAPLFQAPNPASPFKVAVDAGSGVLVAGRTSPVRVSFTNEGKERAKLDPACLTGLGLRLRPANGPVGNAVLDMASFGKEAPCEVPAGATLSTSVDASGLAATLAGKVDSAELWFEVPALGLKSAPVQVELVEDLSKTLVVFETNKGLLKIQLDPAAAPLASRNFARHAAMGTYTGTSFHRVVRGFMAQGGDPNSKDEIAGNEGQGGYPFDHKVLPAELSEVKHVRGTLSMARNGDPLAPYAAQVRQFLSQLYTKMGADPKYVQEQLARLDREGFFKDRKPFLDTGGSQFFLCFGPAPMLDGGYTAFGRLVGGEETLQKIEAVAAASDQDNNGRPKEQITITKVTLETTK